MQTQAGSLILETSPTGDQRVRDAGPAVGSPSGISVVSRRPLQGWVRGRGHNGGHKPKPRGAFLFSWWGAGVSQDVTSPL